MSRHLLKNLILFMVAFFTLSSQSQALILLEPYLGYKMGSGENSLSSKTEYDFDTLTYGARLGVKSLGFSLGLDYSLASGEWEAKSSASTSKDDRDQKSLGAFIGYELPAFFRVWGTYFFETEFEDTTGADSGDTLGGSGLGLALGYTGLPFVSLNLEYRMFTLDERETSGVKTSLNGQNEIDYNEILLSLSVPLDL